MLQQWYYARDDEQVGPFSHDEFQRLVQEGTITREILVWHEELSDWTAAADVAEVEFPPALIREKSPPPIPQLSQPHPKPTVSGLPHVPQWIWSTLIFVACGLLLLAFLSPWWGVSYTNEAGFSPDLLREQHREERITAMWRKQHFSDGKRQALDHELSLLRMGDIPYASVWLWGWNVVAARVGLVMVILLVPFGVLPLCLPATRPWAWIGQFVIALPGLILLTLFLTWFFGAPDRNLGAMEQGLYVGPYLTLLASLLLFVGGLCGGLLGVFEFASKRKQRSRASTVFMAEQPGVVPADPEDFDPGIGASG